MRRAFTLLEVIAVIAIIATVAIIVAATASGVRRAAVAGDCMRKMSQISAGLTLYRMDYGNAEEVVGTAGSLGLPIEPLVMEIPGAPRTADARLHWVMCPLGYDPVLRQRWPFSYMVSSDDHVSRSGWTFLKSTTVLRGETPVVMDWNHNSSLEYLASPRVEHRVLYLTLGGSVRNELVTGIGVDHPGVGVKLEDWVRFKDFEGWQRARR